MPLQKPHIPSFKKLRQIVEHEARSEAEKSVRQFAHDSRDRFVKRIRDQRFESFEQVPLTPHYLAWKESMGLDTRTMIRRKDYINAIDVFEKKVHKRHVLFHVGFDSTETVRNLQGQPLSFPLYKLAAVHEFGSVAANIPARPHWTPFLKEMKEKAVEARKGTAKRTVKRIRNRMKKEL